MAFENVIQSAKSEDLKIRPNPVRAEHETSMSNDKDLQNKEGSESDSVFKQFELEHISETNIIKDNEILIENECSNESELINSRHSASLSHSICINNFRFGA